MKLFSTFLLLSIMIFFSKIGYSQTEYSFTLGTNLAKMTPTDLSLLNLDDIYLTPKNGFNELGTLLGFKAQRQINKQFKFDYQLRLFNQTVGITCVPSLHLHGCQEGKAIGHWTYYELDKADVFGVIHSLSANFRLRDNFYVGIGGYYQMTNHAMEEGKYFNIFRVIEYFGDPYSIRQAGCLGTASYIYKKWTIEVRFLKGIGDVFSHKKRPRFLQSTDNIELSLSYKFAEIKTKKQKANIKKR